MKAGKAFLTHLATTEGVTEGTEGVTSSTGGARAGGARAGGGVAGGGHSGKVECALYLQKRSGGCQLQ